MNVKDLFENKELMESIVEDIEDIPQDSEVCYEVWALGRDDCGESTETDFLIGEFTDPDEAIACAEKFDLETLRAEYEKPHPDTYYLDVVVETVIEDPDDEDGGTMNIGAIYSRDLWIDGEYGSEEDIENPDPTVQLKESDYALLEDGTLKVSRKLLKDFNKNDYVYFRFMDTPNSFPLQYKIVSTVIYEDGDYYHCELMI